MMRFWVGETVRVRVAFTDEGGAPLSAYGVEFRAKVEGGSVVTATPVSAGTGAFYADFPLDAVGTWSLRASCAGPTAAVVEDQIQVRASYVL